MAQKLFEESYIASIAEAIREKNGTTNKYTVAQMADAIRALSTGGGGGSVVAFTVDGNICTADSGKTWEDVYTSIPCGLDLAEYNGDWGYLVDAGTWEHYLVDARGRRIKSNEEVTTAHYYLFNELPNETFTITTVYDGEELTPHSYTVYSGTTWNEFAGTTYEEELGDYWLYGGDTIMDSVNYFGLYDSNNNLVNGNSVIVEGDYYLHDGSFTPPSDTITFTLYDAESIDELDNPETIYKSGDYTVDYGTTWNEFADTTYDEENLGDYWMYAGDPITNGVSGKILVDSNGVAVNGTSVIVKGNYYFVW